MLSVMCFLGPHRTHLVSGVDGEVDGAAVLDPHLGDLGPVRVQHRSLQGKIYGLMMDVDDNMVL